MHRLVAILALCVTAVFAQTNRGSISGTVSDQTQAVMGGVTVTITNLGTNEVRKVTTAANGSYSATNLEPVSYKVEAEFAGFKKTVVDDAKVDTATNTTVNIVLQAGSVDTQVTVTAEATSVNTESGSLSSTVTERQIQDVPLVNRSVLDLALTLPNVSGDAGSENPVIVSVTPCPGCNLTRRRRAAHEYADDGRRHQQYRRQPGPHHGEFHAGDGAGVHRADLGIFGGVRHHRRRRDQRHHQERHQRVSRHRAVVQPQSRISPRRRSRRRPANRPVPTLKYNQFSLAAGGPVYIPKIYNGKNKTFWFAAVEPFYRRDHLDQYGLLPTDGMRNGDFSGLVNTASGWLPQTVVNQFTGVAPASALTPGDSVIYDQYNLINGNQFTPATLPTGSATYVPFPGNVIPEKHAGYHGDEDAALHRQRRSLLPEQQWHHLQHLRAAPPASRTRRATRSASTRSSHRRTASTAATA